MLTNNACLKSKFIRNSFLFVYYASQVRVNVIRIRYIHRHSPIFSYITKLPFQSHNASMPTVVVLRQPVTILVTDFIHPRQFFFVRNVSDMDQYCSTPLLTYTSYSTLDIYGMTHRYLCSGVRFTPPFFYHHFGSEFRKL